MEQNKEFVAPLLSTIDTDHVKSKNQDKEGIPDGVKTSTNAQNAQVVIPDALCFKVVCCTLHPAQFILDAHSHTSCFHSVCVPEKGIAHNPQDLSC